MGESTMRLRTHTNIKGSYPVYSVIPVYGVLCLFFGVSVLLNNWIPQPLLIKDEKGHANRFIAERAMIHLKNLTSFGPRVFGSHGNEILTVEYFIKEIQAITDNSNPVFSIQLDVQKPTGSYFLDNEPYGYTNYYTYVQNVVVRLSSAQSKPHSLLVSCHFDSVPTSPGTSDDGLNCAVMLEILRVLSKSSEGLRHNIIFLFNGAEENPFQAVHGFITQHKWANEIGSFINVEGAGAGGREILFQAGPQNPWLLKLYAASAPYPHGLVIGEEVFQSGLIPSDTDFRIFRDFGHIPGMDFAHKANGYVYHTKYDNLNYVPLGTLQHTGDNILAVIKKIVSSTELDDPEKYSTGLTVYFDFAGLFMIHYSDVASIIINSTAIILSIGTSLWIILKICTGYNFLQKCRHVALGFSVIIVSWLLSLLVAFLTALLLDGMKRTMSWYGKPFIILFLYYCPTLFICMLIPLLCRKFSTKLKILLPIELQSQLHCFCAQIIWTIVLLAATALKVRSSFIVMLLVLFPSVCNAASIFFNRTNACGVWIITLFFSLVIPIFMNTYCSVLIFEIFIPIAGRSGASQNPEILIGIISVFMCILITSNLTPLIVLIRKAEFHLLIFAVLYLITITVIGVSSFGFPYSGDLNSPKPQRISAYHVERMFYNPDGQERRYDSSFWFMPQDRNGAETVMSLIPTAHTLGDEYQREVNCGLPAFKFSKIPQCIQMLQTEAPKPKINNPTNLQLISKEEKSGSIRLTFNVTGSSHMDVHISPFNGVELVAWNFTEEIPSGEPKWKGRPTYVVNYGGGYNRTEWIFWLEFKMQESSDPVIADIGLGGHYKSSSDQLSEEFMQVINKFPDWVHMSPWTATYKSWTF